MRELVRWIWLPTIAIPIVVGIGVFAAHFPVLWKILSLSVMTSVLFVIVGALGRDIAKYKGWF